MSGLGVRWSSREADIRLRAVDRRFGRCFEPHGAAPSMASVLSVRRRPTPWAPPALDEAARRIPGGPRPGSSRSCTGASPHF